jgi:hypothetical protein
MDKLVKISDIFEIKYGVTFELKNLTQCKSTDYNSIPFVSRTEKNNGVSAFVEKLIDIEPNPAHTLSVAVGGSVLSTFYQPKRYYSGFHVFVLIPKLKLSVIEMLFYAKCIAANKYKYNYGRQANRTLKDILVPNNISEKLILKLEKFKLDAENLLIKEPIISKKNDTDEFEFILNNLECLVDGGTCIAIVPMQSALATSGKVFEFKKQLLSKHTLEAVLSMPDELFFNSKVGVVSCIMIFTAHKPHDKNVETYFGYYKNDGFEKRKNIGRTDVHGKWEDIKTKWVNYYKRRKEEPGFSIKKFVNAEMEWCAESYLETDYSTILEEDFEDTILNYVTFLVKNKLTDSNG